MFNPVHIYKYANNFSPNVIENINFETQEIYSTTHRFKYRSLRKDGNYTVATLQAEKFQYEWKFHIDVWDAHLVYLDYKDADNILLGVEDER